MLLASVYKNIHSYKTQITGKRYVKTILNVWTFGFVSQKISLPK